MIHPITNEEILLTKEQQGCVNYIGDKRRDLVIRSAAGGGKSLVLLQRAMKYLNEAKETGKKNHVVIFTYNHVLVEYLKEWMRLTPQDEKYITVGTLHEYLGYIYNKMSGSKLGNPAYDSVLKKALSETLKEYTDKSGNDKYQKWGEQFWKEEFTWMRNMNIFDRSDWLIYKDMAREGRGYEHRMGPSDRMAAFEMFCKYQEKLRSKSVYDKGPSGDERILYLSHKASTIPELFKFDHVLIDEAQDQTLAKMLVLRALAKEDVTVCMDANQRIYEGRWRFSQAQLNPTSRTLTVPFRTTRQIDALAESLKSHNQVEMADEDRVEHATSTALGEKPDIICCADDDEEKRFLIALVTKWLKDDPEHNIGVMCRTNDAVEKIGGWLSEAHIPFQHITKDNTDYSIRSAGIKICTMHTSKGLEFMRVVLPQFYQGHIPFSKEVSDDEKLMQARSVAYVGMTRAMHQLVIIYNRRKSQFIDEMDSSLYTMRTFNDAVESELKAPTPMYEKRVVPKEELADNEPSASVKKPVASVRKAEPTTEKKRRWSF